VSLHIFPSDVPSAPRPFRPRMSGAISSSIAAHTALLGALLWLMHQHVQDAARLVTPPPQRIVWLANPGPSGGGGGSKVAAPRPPRDRPPEATRPPEPAVPIQTPVVAPDLQAEPAEPPSAAAPLADSSSPGAATAAAGMGSGEGAGKGHGDGAGPGKGKGFGDGAYLPGNGVTSPIPIVRATPRYTPDAMRARVQGIITVACVVEPNGKCGDVRVVRGLTPPYGLDMQALETARRWQFRPGTRGDEPVPVLVNLEIEFSIR
jgi:periplasmic protein TonB